jgi:hypothetical protein
MKLKICARCGYDKPSHEFPVLNKLVCTKFKPQKKFKSWIGKKPGIFENIDGKLMIGGKFAFHMFSVYGIPPEILKDIMHEWLNENGNLDLLMNHIQLEGGERE